MDSQYGVTRYFDKVSMSSCIHVVVIEKFGIELYETRSTDAASFLSWQMEWLMPQAVLHDLRKRRYHARSMHGTWPAI